MLFWAESHRQRRAVLRHCTVTNTLLVLVFLNGICWQQWNRRLQQPYLLRLSSVSGLVLQRWEVCDGVGVIWHKRCVRQVKNNNSHSWGGGGGGGWCQGGSVKLRGRIFFSRKRVGKDLGGGVEMGGGVGWCVRESISVPFWDSCLARLSLCS